MFAQAPPATGRDALAWTTFGIAVIGFLLGAISFAWQFVNFRLTGAFVKLSVNSLKGVDPTTFKQVDEIVSLTAYNKGRIPVSIESWGYAINSSWARRRLAWALPRRSRPICFLHSAVLGMETLEGVTFPHTLKPAQEPAHLSLQTSLVRAALENSAVTAPFLLRPYVNLGNGVMKYGPELKLPAAA